MRWTMTEMCQSGADSNLLIDVSVLSALSSVRKTLAKPLFRGGQTVYVESRPGDLRTGDGDIVVVFDGRTDATTATIGYFQYETKDAILIDVLTRGRIMVPTSQQRQIGRINFCRF